MPSIILILTLILPLSTLAQDKPSTKQKIVQANRTGEPIIIDGVLEEQIWQKEGYSDFVQSDPTDGAAPTEKTEVWIAFDDKNL